MEASDSKRSAIASPLQKPACLQPRPWDFLRLWGQSTNGTRLQGRHRLRGSSQSPQGWIVPETVGYSTLMPPPQRPITGLSLERESWFILLGGKIGSPRCSPAPTSDRVVDIDANRQNSNLSSAIRLFVLGFSIASRFPAECERRWSPSANAAAHEAEMAANGIPSIAATYARGQRLILLNHRRCGFSATLGKFFTPVIEPDIFSVPLSPVGNRGVAPWASIL